MPANLGSFTCAQCGKTFGSVQALGGHTAAAHRPRAKPARTGARFANPPGRVRCPICGSPMSLTSFRNHVARLHPSQLGQMSELRRRAYGRGEIEPAPVEQPVVVVQPVVETNGHRLSADEVCAELLAALQPSVPTAALHAVFTWRTATAVMLDAIG